MDSVQKTDLTSDTSVGRTEVDTVDAGDFFEIAKPAEDFKISATNLILGLLKLSVPSDFNQNPYLPPQFSNIDTGSSSFNLSDIDNQHAEVSYLFTNTTSGQKHGSISLLIDPSYQNGDVVYLDLFVAIHAQVNTVNANNYIESVARFYINNIEYNIVNLSTNAATNITSSSMCFLKGRYEIQDGMLLKLG